MEKSFSGKTILVTGATGLIGGHLIDALMEMEDVHVIALSRGKEKLEKGFAKYIGKSNFQYIAQDVTNPLELGESTVDYIFHAAGPMERAIIVKRPVDVINPNITGTENCLKFLSEQHKKRDISGRLILFSSVTVYGNNTENDIKVTEADTNVTEALASGGAPYSQSKRMSEVIAMAYMTQYNRDVVIARFSTVYGNTRYVPDTAFFEFIKRSVEGENIILNGSGFSRRDNIYIDDAVKALLLLAKRGKSGEVYNISSGAELGNFVAVDEIANTIAQIANTKYGRVGDAIKGGRRKGGIILDNSKLKALGWNVETSFEDGVARTIENYEVCNL